MPFRLLGLALDPDQAGELYGQTFASYASVGAEVTLVCLAAAGWEGARAAERAKASGAQDAVLLDYQEEDFEAEAARDVLIDLMAAVRPHVVVADATSSWLKRLAVEAFTAARRHQGGTGALPAKLYYAGLCLDQHLITTAVRTGPGGQHQVFLRAYPRPWITGLLERDLFTGLAAPVEGLSKRLAA